MSSEKKQYQVLKRSTIKGRLWRLAAELKVAGDNLELVGNAVDQAEKDLEVVSVPPEWLSERQVAAQYPLSVKVLQQLRYLGKGPTYHKLSNNRNGRVVYKRIDIELYLSQCRIDTEDQAG